VRIEADVGLAQRFGDERFAAGFDAAQVEFEPPGGLVPRALAEDAQAVRLDDLVGGARGAGDGHQGDVEADAEPAAQVGDRLQSQAVACIADVLVGAVVVGGLALLAQDAFERAAAGAQQRPHQQQAMVAAAEPARLGDAGQPARAGAAQHAEQHRLQVVVGVVGGHQHAGGDLAADVLQRFVAGPAQFVFARPHAGERQPPHVHRQVQSFAEGDHMLGGGAAVRPHAVVHVADVQWPRQSPGTVQPGQRQQQHGAVGAARYRRQHRPFRDEVLEADQAARDRIQQASETVHWLWCSGR
jgi:hypothetical protein